MAGLTSLGIVHTAISLAALGSAVVSFVHHRRILPTTMSGLVYIITTVLTCLTGFGIFQHGGFGKPHALGIVTLVALGVAILTRWRAPFSRRSEAVETVCYSGTVFLSLIPGITETVTRLPSGSPLVDSPDAPALQAAIGVLFLVFVVAATLQLRWIARRGRASTAT